MQLRKRAGPVAWDTAGRPTLDGYGVVVYPKGGNAPPATDADVRIDGPHSVVVVTRP